MALGFRDSEALQVVLRSGLCPPEVLSQSAQIARAGDGGVILEPEKALSSSALAKLRAAGVVTDARLPSDAREVRCWAEALPLQRTGVAEIPSLVLLVTERATELVDLAAELVRLGCDRQELLVAGPSWSEPANAAERGPFGVARVVDPPTYTIVRALDREHGLRAYGPDPSGQELVWTELGYHHPLAEQLRTEAGTLLLVDRDGWRVIPNASWAAVDAALELRVPGDDTELPSGPLPAKRQIELRLAGGRREVPSLWVIRKNGLAVIDRLLDYLPEEIVARLTFAATTGPEPPSGDSEAASPSGDSEAAPQIILRARTGRHPPPDLSLGGDAEEYAPLAQMPDLYAPAGAIVEPPLRRERLRAIVGVDHGQVVWLARTTETKFRVERMPDSAFLPLAEWADYVIHTSAAALVPWTRASIFEFTEFVSNGLEWASGPPEEPAAEVDPKKMKKPGRTRSVQTELEAPLQSPRPTAPQPPSKTKEVGTTPVAEVAIDQELVALESEFVALDAPGDAPERLELFDKLGHAYARLARNRDAGLCFVRSVWESSGADATARLDTWIAADPRRAPAARALDHALAQTVPSNDEVRTVAMLAARAGAAIAKDPHRVHRWLDDHDIELDARTLWLARLGLASLAGGDALGLAHARDRILARLASGLPVERELPAFLRFAGRSGALGNASGEHLASALEELARKFEKTRRKRSVLEAPVAFTNAYVGYQLAYGFARIGKHERARALVAESHRALKAVENDVVHGYLMAAYASRVEQAIAGLAPETPLAGELAARLAKLAPLMRYTIDRLREGSRILEPVERPDAFGGFIRSHKDSRGPEFEALRTITDLVARAKAVDRLVGLAAKTEPDRERLIDGIFDVLLELPESAAVPILLRTWPLIEQLAEPRRAVLYAEALVVAGHFGRTELVRELLEVLGTAIRSVTGADLERVLQQSLRALRRIGLRHEIAELLAEAEHALPATNAVDALRGRLALAAGLAFLGDSARALPIFDQARKMLGETGMIATARLDLTRALALAYAQAPLSNALGGIAELAGQLRDVTDNYGTNSHYCLSVLHFVESLVLGITSDDLALGEAGRRFIEDDEHLIRRRLHRDLGGPS